MTSDASALTRRGATARHADPSEIGAARGPWGDPTDPVAPSREDPTVASASEVLGGPLGRHAVIGVSGVAAALASIAAAVTGLVAFGVVERAHCLNNGWSTPDHFWHACYSDIPVVYDSSGLRGGVSPFADGSRLEQALPTSLVSWFLARLVPDGASLVQMRWYFALWAVLAVVLLVGLVAALVRTQPRHPWRVAHLASPALPFAVLASFEVVPVALAGFGIAAWAGRRRAVAGVLLGLAALARPVAVLGLVAVVLLGVRAGRLRDAATTVGAAVITVGGALTVGSVLGGGAVVAPYRTFWQSVAAYGSPWYLSTLGGSAWSAPMMSVMAVLGWVVALVAGAYLALAAKRRPRLGELVLVMTAIVLLTGKSLPVQVSLWMILLMALVGVSWRLHLAWAATEVAYFVAVWLNIAASSAPDRGLPNGWYAVFLAARVVAWAWVAVAVWRRAVARPAAGVVQEPLPDAADPLDEVSLDDGREAAPAEVTVVEDDELAGAYAGRPDHTVVTFV